MTKGVPPVVQELNSDDDTQYFDADLDKVEVEVQSFPPSKAFAGNHLPFIGFTYSSDYQFLSSQAQPPSSPKKIEDSNDVSNNVSNTTLFL